MGKGPDGRRKGFENTLNGVDGGHPASVSCPSVIRLKDGNTSIGSSFLILYGELLSVLYTVRGGWWNSCYWDETPEGGSWGVDWKLVETGGMD